MVSKVLYALVVAGISIESSRLTTVSYTVGPVCAKCSDGYSFRQSTQECEPCRRSGGMDALTIIFLILLAVLFSLSAYCFCNPNFRTKAKNIDDF